MAKHRYNLTSEPVEIVLVKMSDSFNVVDAIEWCESDDAPGVFSYGSIWNTNRVGEITMWEFRFTNPHTAFDFKLRWC